VWFVRETAQGELRSGRVYKAPAHNPGSQVGQRSKVISAPRRRQRFAEQVGAVRQGLTLDHFSAQCKHVLWDTLSLWVGSMTWNGSG